MTKKINKKREKPFKKGEKKLKGRDEKGRFVKGEYEGGPGRPPGTKNFATIFEQAAREVAQALRLGEKPDMINIELVKRGISEGLSGKFPYYKDILDRLYGQPRQPIEHEVGTNSLLELEKILREIAEAPKKDNKKK